MDPDLDPQKVETRYIRGKKISSGVINFFKTIFNLFFFSKLVIYVSLGSGYKLGKNRIRKQIQSILIDNAKSQNDILNL